MILSWLILISAIIFPLIMLILVQGFPVCRLLFDGLAVLSAYAVAIITAIAVYQIIRDDMVFMTKIHGVFNNAAFLASGAYLGNYGLYKLIHSMLKHWKNNN